ncbi:MAG TPA: ribonuclease Z [Bacillota bacterium]|nr:ribonuclease Z [Bacillota bacterium]
MKLIFLGTGAGVPSKLRNVSSVALSLLQETNNVWLFDCGEATQHQILRTTIKPRKINKIFITHLHGDHLFGLPGFLSSRSFQGGDQLLTIYGPKGIKQYVKTSLKISQTHVTYPIEIVEITTGKLYEDDYVTIYCQKLDHGIPSYGFRIVEKDKLGELQADKLQAIGIPPGPIYQQIKENDSVTLPDGRQIFRKDFLGPMKRGRVVTIFGDTRYVDQHADFVKHADVLVHEATFTHENRQLADAYFHSTTTQAAQLAKKGHVKQLVLTHISSRYQPDDWPNLLHEAQKIFPSTQLAYDFFELEIEAPK